MSVRWKKLLGDSSAFAIEIAFSRDPDPGNAVSREMSESWGSFKLWVDGRNLCQHDEDEERVDSVHWYLLPLIEWFIESWDPLFHEERLPHEQCRGTDAWAALMENCAPSAALSDGADLDWLAEWQGWWHRHSLQAARHGGLFPGVVIRRRRHQIEIAWGPNGLVEAPAHFRFTHPRDHARLQPSEVAQPLFQVIGEALAQLSMWVPESEHLKTLIARHEKLRSVEPDSRLAWLAGMKVPQWRSLRRALQDRFRQSISALEPLFAHDARQLVIEGSCRAPLMFGSLSPAIGEPDLVELTGKLIDAYVPDREPVRLDELAEPRSIGDGEPWRQAYELAEDVLRQVGRWEGPAAAIELDRLLDELGACVDSIELADASTRGIAFVSPEHRPTILINRHYRANQKTGGYRFTLAHELCHLLFDRSEGRELALASGPWAPADVEQRANAFAAMFLLPTERIRRLIPELEHPLDRKEGIQEVARRMETGFIATLEHLTNVGFVSKETKQAIEAE